MSESLRLALTTVSGHYWGNSGYCESLISMRESAVPETIRRGEINVDGIVGPLPNKRVLDFQRINDLAVEQLSDVSKAFAFDVAE